MGKSNIELRPELFSQMAHLILHEAENEAIKKIKLHFELAKLNRHRSVFNDYMVAFATEKLFNDIHSQKWYTERFSSQHLQTVNQIIREAFENEQD